jgi:PiT family inorganic phosphate transporter
VIDNVDWPTAGVVTLALVFGYMNGVIISGGLVAAAIASRSLRPRAALLLASLAVLVGPFLFGTAVAATLGAGLLDEEVVDLTLVACALVGAVGWNAVAVAVGWPTSASHALLGGLVGAALAAGGADAVMVDGLVRILVGLVFGPALGLLGGYVALRLILRVLRGASPAANQALRQAQTAALIVLGLALGTNDAQKTMAVIVLATLESGTPSSFTVPEWVTVASAVALALGVATGGSRVIRTLGVRLYRIRPIHAFSAQSSAALVVLAATALGLPVSTGQAVSSSILGVGAAYRRSAVRWGVARSIVVAWLVTIPLSGFAAAGAFWLLSML